VPAVKLTSLSHGAGCACKLPATELHALLGDLPAGGGGDLLVCAAPGAGAPGVRIGRLGEGEAGRIEVSA
jgi:hypothetical protein